MSKTEDSKAADAAFLEKLVSECQNKAVEWEQRQKSATAEMEAIEKAKEILSSGVKAMFVQLSVKKTSLRAKAKADDAREQLIHTLKRLGREYNSFALMQMASAAKADPFAKVRGMVEEMISKLEKQAQEEATHEAFCQEEQAKSKKSRKVKQASVDKYQTRLDKASATVDTLTQEIGDLQQQLADASKAKAEATKIRAQENADYKVSSKDFRESADAVTQAITVLREFYGGASFIQQPSFGSSKGDAGGSIISFLEVSQEDFERLYAETEQDEQEAKAAYEKLMQEDAVSTATKKASVKAKQSEVKSLKTAIQDSGSDLTSANEELDAVMEYIEKLKPQCESKAMTYEERKARRDAEIAGLKEALEILAGDAPALSFLQKRM